MKKLIILLITALLFMACEQQSNEKAKAKKKGIDAVGVDTAKPTTDADVSYSLDEQFTTFVKQQVLVTRMMTGEDKEVWYRRCLELLADFTATNTQFISSGEGICRTEADKLNIPPLTTFKFSPERNAEEIALLNDAKAKNNTALHEQLKAKYDARILREAIAQLEFADKQKNEKELVANGARLELRDAEAKDRNASTATTRYDVKMLTREKEKADEELTRAEAFLRYATNIVQRLRAN